MFNDEIGVDAFEDNYNGAEDMEEKTEKKYLGDLLSNDGRNVKNIKARIVGFSFW